MVIMICAPYHLELSAPRCTCTIRRCHTGTCRDGRTLEASPIGTSCLRVTCTCRSNWRPWRNAKN